MDSSRLYNLNKQMEDDNDDVSLRLSLGGLPSSPDQVDQGSTGEDDSPTVVYKAIAFSDSSAIMRMASNIPVKSEANHEFYVSMTADKPSVELTPVSIKYVDIERPVCFSHVNVLLSEAETLNTVDNFLKSFSISCDKRDSCSNIYNCKTVVDCNIVKFVIRLVPSRKNQGIDIEMKRTVGCPNVFAKVFNKFKQFVPTMSSSACKSATRTVVKLDDHDDVDMAEINKALLALEQWIVNDPLEALQSIGQFFIELNVYVLQSARILDAICCVVEKYQDCSADSMLLLSLALSCLRQFITSSSIQSPQNELSVAQVKRISKAVIRCAMSADLTARREAVGLLVEMNPLLSAEIKMGINEFEPLAFSAVKTSFQTISVI